MTRNPPTLGNAGTVLPVPDDFDFEGWMEEPHPILVQDGQRLPNLRTRNKENIIIEEFNEESIVATLNCQCDRINHPDVGEMLKPLWPYTNEELTELALDDEFRKDVGPLPLFIRGHIQGIKEGKKSSLVDNISGSMILSNPITRVPGQQLPVDFPLVFLQTLKNTPIPLTWFSNDRIRQAMHDYNSIHTKQIRPEPTQSNPNPEKVTILDLQKMSQTWGLDDHPDCMSPLEFQQFSKNFLAALGLLCPPSVPSTQTYAAEMEKHFKFFLGLEEFEKYFTVWYSFERKSRHEILKGILFDINHYDNNVRSLMHAWNARLAVDVPLITSTKRQNFNSDSRLAKAARTSNSSPSSFRTRRSPSCVVCASAHTVFEHPSSQTSFQDGKPHYAIFKDGTLFISRPKDGKEKKICLAFNLPAGCDNSSPEHTNDRCHVCSLCGGPHAALSRNTKCSRVSEGKLRA
jgi:hypothetical protein